MDNFIEYLNTKQFCQERCEIQKQLIKRKEEFNVPTLEEFHRMVRKEKFTSPNLASLVYDYLGKLVRADLISFDKRYSDFSFPRVDWDFYRRKAKPKRHLITQQRLRKSFVYVAKIILHCRPRKEFLDFYNNLLILFPDRHTQNTSLKKLHRTMVNNHMILQHHSDFVVSASG